MKIYEFSYKDGQKEWVFAPTIKEAREFYISFSGCGDLEDCEVKSVPRKEWSEIYILDIDEPEPYPEEEDYNEEDYSCGYKIQESFAEYAESNRCTDMIATTEF